MQIRNPLSLALACVWLGLGVQAQDKPQDKFQTPRSFERQLTVRGDYLLFLPKDYAASPEKRWPLILFLHGAGERGTNVWTVDIHGPAKYIADHPDFPFILVSPQCPLDQSWSNETLLGLLDDVMARYRVDPQRVYLTGLSMGGYGTWSLAAAYPERFAAAVPICGGGNLIDVLLSQRGFTSPGRRAALKGLPIWAFHGGKDDVVPPAESERMIQAMKLLGASEAKLTIYPEASHNSWEQTYTNADLYAWLLEHKRRP
jgi:predicted peptidase